MSPAACHVTHLQIWRTAVCVFPLSKNHLRDLLPDSLLRMRTDQLWRSLFLSGLARLSDRSETESCSECVYHLAKWILLTIFGNFLCWVGFIVLSLSCKFVYELNASLCLFGCATVRCECAVGWILPSSSRAAHWVSEWVWLTLICSPPR